MTWVRRGVLVTLLSAVAAETGCYHAVARAGQQAGAEETRTGWNLFWGLFDANFDITSCPSGIAYAEVWHPWWGFIPEILTLGIASPQRLTYVCSAATGGGMQPTVIMQQPGYAPPPAPMPQYQPQPAPPPPAAAAPAPYQPPAAPAANEAPASGDDAAEDAPAPKPAKKTKKTKKAKKKPAPAE